MLLLLQLSNVLEIQAAPVLRGAPWRPGGHIPGSRFEHETFKTSQTFVEPESELTNETVQVNDFDH